MSTEQLEDTYVMEDEYNLPNVARSPLSLTLMSAVLEHNGEVGIEDFYDSAAERGIHRMRTRSCIRKILSRRDMVEIDGEAIVAREPGVVFVARNIDKLAEAEEQAAAKKVFTPAKYEFLDLLKDEADPDGWLAGQPLERGVVRYLAEVLASSHPNMQRRLSRYRLEGLVEHETILTDHGNETIMRIKLTEAGHSEHELMRQQFADKIAELAMKPVDTDKLSHEALLQTARFMGDEVNNMLYELGRPPRDFGDIESSDADELQALIDELGTTQERLEARLDASRSLDLLPAAA